MSIPPPPPLLGKFAPPPPPPLLSPLPVPGLKTVSIYPKPSCKLKMMTWKSIAPKYIEGSLWEAYESNKKIFVDCLDYKRLDQLFAANNYNEKKKEELGEEIDEVDSLHPNGKNMKMIQSFIDDTSKMMIAILTRVFNLTPKQYAQALFEMNDSIFTVNLCAQLRKCFWRLNDKAEEVLKADDKNVKF
jgi:hypothetical protein